MANTTLYPDADAFIRDVLPDDNFGTNASLAVYTMTNNNYRSFLKFDLSGLPVGAIITLAKLRINCYNATALSAPDTNVQACRVADDSWLEVDNGGDGITWNNQPAHGAVEDTEVPSVAWVEWIVTNYVQDESDDDRIISFCMRKVTEDFDGTPRYSYYRSREYDAGSTKPELYIEYELPSVGAPVSSVVIPAIMLRLDLI